MDLRHGGRGSAAAQSSAAAARQEFGEDARARRQPMAVEATPETQSSTGGVGQEFGEDAKVRRQATAAAATRRASMAGHVEVSVRWLWRH